MHFRLRLLAVLGFAILFSRSGLPAQSANSGTLNGSVVDATGAVIPGASVTIDNPVSRYHKTMVSDAVGHYQFLNLPFNPYHLTATAPGFAPFVQDVEVRSVVVTFLDIKLNLGATSTTVTVESGGDMVENDSSFHSDVDRAVIEKLPLESASSSLSSLVTLTSPGVAADSNGLFHGLGDHASNSFSIDGQQITDQQSKVFSNQLPSNSIQSMEVISGAPPAEYGDKTALIINVTTRSGMGVHPPTGSISTSYGSFGSATGAFDLSYGKEKWGNFIEIDGLNTGRFLDPPEFSVFHDKGNEENLFDRIDYQLSTANSAHLDLNYSRSWFQNPNAYDNLNVTNVISGGSTANPVFGNVGNTDQHSQIKTFNIAPTFTHLMGTNAVFTLAPYVRKDIYNYYPSGDALADKGPPNLQNETVGQNRTLTNAGIHSDISYVRGINTIKTGVRYEQTFLNENDSLGIVSSTFNSPCVFAGAPVSGLTDPSQCAAFGYQPNTAFLPILLPYDLTRGGGNYVFNGHTDVKELALYAEDQIKAANWLFNLGIRGDFYNGLTTARQAEPRLGVAYTIKQTNTVLRTSYARTLETPFNENLILSSNGCLNAVLSPLLACTPGVSGTLQPGFKNEFHAGLQQAFGKNLVVSGDYIWKYTHNAFDFSVLGNTPITFPIDWHNSKIPGFALRADVPNFHNLTAFVVMSSVAARFFPPQVAGAGATVGHNGLPFRIDHDERFNQTTHLQYQIPLKHVPWTAFNWRFDSGQVAGQAPFATDSTTPVNLTNLTADQQQQAGLLCGNQKATLSNPLTSCAPALLGSTLLTLPAPGTENADKNPPRIQARNLFDASAGEDNLFNGDKYKWSARITGTNITNKYSLYNFLSTFSGTHYVTPRSVTAEIGFHF